MKVDLVVLDGSEESFGVRIVRGTPFSIHGDFHSLQTFDVLDVFLTGELASLVGVDDLRRPVSSDGLLDTAHHPFGIHRVGDVPADSVPAVNIDDGHQVYKPLAQWDVADFELPHLVGPTDVQTPEQIGILVLGRIADRGLRLAVNRRNGHKAHQAEYFVFGRPCTPLGLERRRNGAPPWWDPPCTENMACMIRRSCSKTDLSLW